MTTYNFGLNTPSTTATTTPQVTFQFGNSGTSASGSTSSNIGGGTGTGTGGGAGAFQFNLPAFTSASTNNTTSSLPPLTFGAPSSTPFAASAGASAVTATAPPPANTAATLTDFTLPPQFSLTPAQPPTANAGAIAPTGNTLASTTQTSAPLSSTLSTAPTTFFGAAAATTANTTTAPSSTSTFSFSLPATSAATATFPSFGASTTASAATTPATTTTTTTTLSSTTTSAPAADTISRIKHKSIDEIIDLWSADLEDHIAAFTSQCALIQSWDEQLIKNYDTIITLQTQVDTIQQQQMSMSRVMETIKSNQSELAVMLDSLENAIDSLPKPNATSLTSDDVRREKTYALAEQLDDDVHAMAQSLTSTIATLNSSNAAGLDDLTSPLMQLVAILNVHQNSLQWIETTTNELDQNITKTQLMIKAENNNNNNNNMSYNKTAQR